MREIKFRVWDFHEKEMNYNLNAILFEMTKRSQYSVNVGKGYGNRTFNVCDFYLDDDGNEIEKDNKDAELMQFTGLTDRNGVEIYEGDILSYRYVVTYVDASDGANLGMSVGWYEQRDNFESFRQLEVGDKLEVLGNIYEHPHLLEGVK